MKKSNLVVVGLVGALLLSGIAFAAWTTRADVKVNATSGELDVEITASRVITVANNVEFDNTNIVISADKKVAQVAMNNFYPGAVAEFEIDITNVGTLPVTLDKIIHETIGVVGTDGTDYGLDISIFRYLYAEYSAKIFDASGTQIAATGIVSGGETDWTTEHFAGNSLPNIAPGEKIVLKVKVGLGAQAEDNTQNMVFSFSVSPLFEQGQ